MRCLIVKQYRGLWNKPPGQHSSMRVGGTSTQLMERRGALVELSPLLEECSHHRSLR